MRVIPVTSLSSTVVLRRSMLAALFAAGITAASYAASPHAATPESSAASASPAIDMASYGQLPLNFEVNRGQTDPSVQFVAHGPGYTLFLRQGEAVLSLQSQRAKAGSTNSEGRVAAQPPSIVRMELASANRHARVTEEDKQETRTNYFLGNDPTKWRTDIPNYGRVRYSAIYPGIDLVYYGNQRQLEYDFVVAAGADPAAIRLKFSGQKKMEVTSEGDLVLDGEQGSATLHKPVVYQESSSGREPVTAGFRLARGNTATFTLGRYDHRRPLIIDPVLVYSTYLGGSGTKGSYYNYGTIGDSANAIAVDASGYAYLTGMAGSLDFPVSSGAFQSTNGASPSETGVGTVFVTKLNQTGKNIAFSTYLGGNMSNGKIAGETGHAIAVDASSNILVAGSTSSNNFPVTCGAYQTTYNITAGGAWTGFVTKLNAQGDGLVYSTYLGGSGGDLFGGSDNIVALAVDSAGHAFVTGITGSMDFPATSKAFDTTYNGASIYGEAFVAELSADGTALVYSTFLGGNNNYGGTGGNAITVDSSGDAFVTGFTGSTDFQVTSGAFQSASTGSTSFVTELNPTGTQEVFSTYLGGSGGDSAMAIALDSNGYPYVAGNTSSTDFPLTNGLEGSNTGDQAYYAMYGLQGTIGFVTKLAKDGSALEYSTYVEGQYTTIKGLAVDSSGAAYVAGTTANNSPGTYGWFQQTPDALPFSGTQYLESFVAKLDPTATYLNYAGMIDAATVNALAMDSSGNVYLAGAAQEGLTTTQSAFQTTDKGAANGSSNAFALKISLGSESNQTSYYGVPGGNPVPVDTTIDISPGDYSLQSYYGCGDFVNYELTGDLFIDPVTPNVLPLTGTFSIAVGGGGQGSDEETLAQGTDDNPFDLAGEMTPGYYPITASYSGDVNYNPSTATINYNFDCPGNDPGVVHSPSSTSANQPFRLALHPRAPSLTSRPAKVLTASRIGAPNPLGIKFPGLTLSPALHGARLQSSVSSQDTPACILPSSPFIARPLSLAFSAAQAGANPPSQTLAITSTSGGTKWHLTKSQSWLLLSTTAGTVPGSVVVTPNIVGLKGGTYSATITITPEEVTTSATVIPVTLTIISRAATPNIGFGSGTYSGTQKVYISSATSPATIYYTVDGSTPTNSSTRYLGALTVKTSETIKAIAYASGYNPSLVGTAVYIIDSPAPTPTFSPKAGTYSAVQTVTITDSAGGTIYYTTDGSTPTSISTRYLGPITLKTSETIKAIDTASGYSASAVATATYDIEALAAKPVLSLASGTYASAQTLTITDADKGTIYYTTNGTTPTNSSTRYLGPISVKTSETVKAIEYASGYSPSAVATGTYTIQ